MWVCVWVCGFVETEKPQTKRIARFVLLDGWQRVSNRSIKIEIVRKKFFGTNTNERERERERKERKERKEREREKIRRTHKTLPTILLGLFFSFLKPL